MKQVVQNLEGVSDVGIYIPNAVVPPAPYRSSNRSKPLISRRPLPLQILGHVLMSYVHFNLNLASLQCKCNMDADFGSLNQ